jgi:hypothetical protein
MPIDRYGRLELGNYAHWLLKIELKSGAGVYALDLAGAQFGYFGPITPWNIYLATRIERLNIPNDGYSYLGKMRHLLLRKRESESEPYGVGPICRINAGAHKAMKNHTVQWEEENYCTVQDIIKLKGRAFERKEQDLISYISSSLRAHLNSMKRKGEAIRAQVQRGDERGIGRRMPGRPNED